MLEELLPDVKFSNDTTAGTIVAWARARDHEVIAETIEKMEAGELRTVETYNLDGPAVGAVMAMSVVVPEANCTVGPDPNQLIAWARPADHLRIQDVLDKIQDKGPPEKRPSLVVYSLRATEAESAMPIITTAVPNAQLNQGTLPNQILAWAKPEDHKTIAETIAKIDLEEPAETAPRAVVYSLEETSSTRAYYKLRLVREAVPSADFTLGSDPNNLIAWARPTDHEKIKQIIEELTSKGPAETRPTVVIYTLKSTTADAAESVLDSMVPNAEITVGEDPRQLIAFARPVDHEEIEAALKQIDIAEPAETAPRLVIYTLQTATADDAMDALAQAVPTAQINEGSIPNQLFAWARPDDHKKIETAIAQIDAAEPEATAPRAVVYALDETSTSAAYYKMRLLREVVPSASFTLGADPSNLIAWARPAEHEKIAEVVEQLVSKGPADKRPTMVVYTLRSISAETAIRVLGAAAPGAELDEGDDPSQMIAWAKPSDHEEIVAALAKIDVEQPPETAATLVIYTLQSTTADDAEPVLATAAPNAQIDEGTIPNQLFIWARPDDHKKLEATIAKLDAKEPEATAPRAVLYTLQGSTSRTGAIYRLRLLEDVAPAASFTFGSDVTQLIAWARPADHEKIKEVVEQFGSKGPPELRPSLAVYTLESTSADVALGVLSDAVPEAEFSEGTDPSQVVAWARPADHEEIEAILAKLDVADPAETAAKVEVYTLESGTAAGAMAFLVSAHPQAKITPGTNPRQIIVWARPAEHEKIKLAIERLSQKESAATAPTVKTYSVEVNGAAKVISLLSTAVPDAQLSVGANPSQLIAYAGPADQEIIAKAIEQVEAAGLRDTSRTLTVYDMRAEDVPSLMLVLDPALTQNAQFVTDPNRDTLIVWATPKIQAALKNAVEEFQEKMPEPVEPVAKVYRFEEADPAAALTVLTALVPSAEIAMDEATGNLVVSALPDDHEKIQATIDEMDRKDAAGQAPTLEIYPLVSVDPAGVLPALQTLFSTNSRIQLSLDARNDALIAVATPKEHQRIKELLAKVEQGALTDTQSTLQLYSMKDVDSYSAMEILETVLAKQGVKADLSIDSGTNQLVAMARPAQHETIKSTLEKLRQEERTMEILQLDYLEPDTANLAIMRLFSDEGFSNQPAVSSDQDTGQLFVRATQEQHTEIRALLIKLGETELKTLGAATDARLRVIPFGGDAKAAVEEIRRIWPQLRDNPIRMVAPSSDDGAAIPSETPIVRGQDPDATAEEPAPVLVVVAEGSITLASEDVEALDQFESLLRTMSQRTGYIGRDFSIFAVRNTGAAGIAATLEELFRSKTRTRTSSGSYRTASPQLIIVPDGRLNTILVQGSRADRAKIEGLLKVLDTAEVPKTLPANKPKLIPIVNTKATRIEQVIRDMFETQLSSSGGKDSLPSWLSSEMSVDEVTNSLVVMAPSPLIDEITDLAERLDKAAGENPAEGIKIIALKKINAARAVEALEQIRGRSSSR